MDTLWSRRTNSGKLSLSTVAGQAEGSARGNTSLSKRFGGDGSSHGKTSNPFSTATTPGGGLSSPTGGASSAFGLGSGAFASFGSAKTPKTPGNPNPFEAVLGASSVAAKTPAANGTGVKTMGRSTTSPSLQSSEFKVATASSTWKTDPGKTLHPLHSSWVFWFRPPISKANGYVEYEKTLHPIATCETAEEFFAVYAHLKRPSALPPVSDYHLFRPGIRPIWEDEENKKGGKWIVRLKKGVADRYWEDLLLAIVGDQFGEAGEEVCGAVLSVRNGEDVLSIWARTDGGRVLKIRETMKRFLGLPPDTKIEWKSHDSAMQQRTAIEESRREKANSNYHNDKRANFKNLQPSSTQAAAEDQRGNA